MIPLRSVKISWELILVNDVGTACDFLRHLMVCVCVYVVGYVVFFLQFGIQDDRT
jgi:hypothetical protein